MELMPTAALTQLPFLSACEAWLESRRPYISAKTHHEYKLNIKTLSAFFGELRLQEIDGDLIRAYQRTRKLKCGPFAINHECGVLCQIRKRIGLPVEDYQPLPLPKELRGQALNDEQRARLFRVAQSNPNWEAIYCLALISVNTCMAPKETFTLRLKDVDLKAATVTVQPGGAKNIHRLRRIPLNQEALEAVKLAIARAQSLGATEPEHYIFPFRYRGGNVHVANYDPTRHQTTFKTAWKKLKTVAQIPTTFRIEDFRHTGMTNLMESADVSEEVVENIAGHVSRRMKKTYSHIRLQAMRAALDGIQAKKPAKNETRSRKKPAISTERDQLVSQLSTLLAKLLKTA